MTNKRAIEVAEQLDIALATIANIATGGMISRSEYVAMQDSGRIWNHEILIGCDCANDDLRVLDLDFNDVHLLDRKTGKRTYEGKYDSNNRDQCGYYNSIAEKKQ